MSLILLFTTFTATTELPRQDPQLQEWIWEKGNISPFDELILSWNGMRPAQGKWVFWVRLRQKEWSPWLRYAEWSPQSQRTFRSAPEGSWAESYQDAAFPKEGLCDAFQIKVTAEDGASLAELQQLFVCTSHTKQYQISPPSQHLATVFLPAVPRQSQIVLDHPRHRDLCSPTSTSTALNYLLGRSLIDPVAFAGKIHDDEFDIYGNWVLNTAQAFEEAKGMYKCHVERLNNFQDLHAYLMQGLPVVVSVKGSLPQAPQPYLSGHLMCVVGYDAAQARVYCVDSAFPDSEATYTSYPLPDFLEAWGRRKNLAYVFPRKVP